MSEINQKLIVLFDTFTELYCIPASPQGKAYNGKFFINYLPVMVDNSSKWFTTKRKPESAHVINTIAYRDGWLNDRGDSLTNEEYSKKVQELRTSWDEDDEEWGDVEQEIRYAKFTKEWKANLKEKEVRIDYEIAIQLAPVSAHPEIQLVTSWDDILTAKEAMFKYFPRPVLWMEQKCKSLGLEQVKEARKNAREFSIPNHGGIRFTQLAGHYICSDQDENGFKFVHQGTYQSCIDKLNEHKAIIEDIVQRGYVKAFPMALNEMSSRIVVDFIQNFEMKYKEIKPMKSSYNDYAVLRKWFNEFKEQFTNSLKND